MEQRNSADGTKEFDEEGIQKLSDLVDDDLQDILDRLDAICSDDNAYHSFSGKEDDMERQREVCDRDRSYRQ